VNRSECRGGPRPCPLVSCRHHLLIASVTADPVAAQYKCNRRSMFSFNRLLADRYGLTNAMIEAYPLTALSLLPETCSLDVADRGSHLFTEIAPLLGETREAPRQLFERLAERMRDNKRTGPLLREMLDQANEVAAGQHDPVPQQLKRMRAPAGEQTVIVHFQKPVPGSWAWRKRGAA